MQSRLPWPEGCVTGKHLKRARLAAWLPDEAVSTHFFVQVLCLHPTGELNLKPKGDTCKVEVVFSPKRRIQPFAGEVMLESKGLARSLFMVRGSCQGIHVSLDQEHLNFGAVLQQSQASQRIVMQNTGDIGVK